jgi:hypothetical protein
MDSRLSVGAAAAMSALPTGVDPVKDSFRTDGAAHRTPAVAAWSSPITTLNTPGGTPAASAICAMATAEKGVLMEGRRMTVQPAARAGATFRAGIAAGKFHGVSAAAGPTGAWRTTIRRSARIGGRTSPYARLASSAYHSKKSAAYTASPRPSPTGLPVSAVTTTPSADASATIIAAIFRTMAPRSNAVLAAHAGNASAAAATAAAVSAAPMSGTMPRGAPSAGFVTVYVAPDAAGTHRPLMYPTPVLTGNAAPPIRGTPPADTGASASPAPPPPPPPPPPPDDDDDDDDDRPRRAGSPTTRRARNRAIDHAMAGAVGPCRCGGNVVGLFTGGLGRRARGRRTRRPTP